MAAIDDIARALDLEHGSYRAGMRAFAERSLEALPAVRAAPELYGDLAFHYADWVVRLVRAMREAADSRPDGRPSLDAALDLSASYFTQPSRWPAVSRLEGSPQLLIPAYYTTCSMQVVNARLIPPLLIVNFEDPLAFVVDVIGRKAAHEIREQKNSDLRDARGPDGAAPDGTKPRAFKQFLSADRKRQLTQARTSTPAPPATSPTLPPPPPPVRDLPAEARAAWRDRLSGRRLTFTPSSMRDSDYSGGGYFHSSEKYLELSASGRYRAVEEGVSRVSSGGLTLGGPFRKETSGTWDITGAGVSIELVLQGSQGDQERYNLADRGGAISLDGQVCRSEVL